MILCEKTNKRTSGPALMALSVDFGYVRMWRKESAYAVGGVLYKWIR